MYILYICVLSRFSHVWLFAMLWTIACQVPLSMGFSKKEYWSGLSCPPPGILLTQGSKLCLLHLRHCGFFTTSATWEAYTVLCFVAQSCPTLCNPVDCSPSGSSVHGIGQARVLEWEPPPGDFPKLGIKPRSSVLQADSLPSEPPGKTKNTGIGSLSLLQRIFPTQESN